jgi:hypothetical protein
MYRDELMSQDHEMGIKVLKHREGIMGRVIMSWDFTTMNFEEIYSVEDGGGSGAPMEGARENIAPRGAKKQI